MRCWEDLSEGDPKHRQLPTASSYVQPLGNWSWW